MVFTAYGRSFAVKHCVGLTIVRFLARGKILCGCDPVHARDSPRELSEFDFCPQRAVTCWCEAWSGLFTGDFHHKQARNPAFWLEKSLFLVHEPVH